MFLDVSDHSELRFQFFGEPAPTCPCPMALAPFKAAFLQKEHTLNSVMFAFAGIRNCAQFMHFLGLHELLGTQQPKLWQQSCYHGNHQAQNLLTALDSALKEIP